MQSLKGFIDFCWMGTCNLTCSRNVLTFFSLKARDLTVWQTLQGVTTTQIWMYPFFAKSADKAQRDIIVIVAHFFDSLGNRYNKQYWKRILPFCCAYYILEWIPKWQKHKSPHYLKTEPNRSDKPWFVWLYYNIRYKIVDRTGS